MAYFVNINFDLHAASVNAVIYTIIPIYYINLKARVMFTRAVHLKPSRVDNVKN